MFIGPTPLEKNFSLARSDLLARLNDSNSSAGSINISLLTER
jgi:hypothetical protein